jgi:hypothetical protein
MRHDARVIAVRAVLAAVAPAACAWFAVGLRADRDQQLATTSEVSD